MRASPGLQHRNCDVLLPFRRAALRDVKIDSGDVHPFTESGCAKRFCKAGQFDPVLGHGVRKYSQDQQVLDWDASIWSPGDHVPRPAAKAICANRASTALRVPSWRAKTRCSARSPSRATTIALGLPRAVPSAPSCRPARPGSIAKVGAPCDTKRVGSVDTCGSFRFLGFVSVRRRAGSARGRSSHGRHPRSQVPQPLRAGRGRIHSRWLRRTGPCRCARSRWRPALQRRAPPPQA